MRAAGFLPDLGYLPIWGTRPGGRVDGGRGTAVTSDLMLVYFPERSVLRRFVTDFFERLESRFNLPDLAHRLGEIGPIRRAVGRVVSACDLSGWTAPFRLRDAIEGLREEAGSGVMTCLIPRPEI